MPSRAHGPRGCTAWPSCRRRASRWAALAAYRVGRVDLLTLLDSQMTVFSYEINLAQTLAAHTKALAEIDFLAGKAWN